MVFVDGIKYACGPCTRGHRAEKCNHADRPLVEVKKKGRPKSQCIPCQEARKRSNTHAVCLHQKLDSHAPPLELPNGAPATSAVVASRPSLPSSHSSSSSSATSPVSATLDYQQQHELPASQETIGRKKSLSSRRKDSNASTKPHDLAHGHSAPHVPICSPFSPYPHVISHPHAAPQPARSTPLTRSPSSASSSARSQALPIGDVSPVDSSSEPAPSFLPPGFATQDEFDRLLASLNPNGWQQTYEAWNSCSSTDGQDLVATTAFTASSSGGSVVAPSGAGSVVDGSGEWLGTAESEGNSNSSDFRGCPLDNSPFGTINLEASIDRWRRLPSVEPLSAASVIIEAGAGGGLPIPEDVDPLFDFDSQPWITGTFTQPPFLACSSGFDSSTSTTSFSSKAASSVAESDYSTSTSLLDGCGGSSTTSGFPPLPPPDLNPLSFDDFNLGSVDFGVLSVYEEGAMLGGAGATMMESEGKQVARTWVVVETAHTGLVPKVEPQELVLL